MASTSVLALTSILPNETISKLKHCKTMKQFHQIHAHIIKTNLINHTSTMTKLIIFCSLSHLPNSLSYSSSIFHRIKNPNHFIYYALIKACCEYGDPLHSLVYYIHMVSSSNHQLGGFAFCLPYVLKACGKLRALDQGNQLFAQIVKTLLWFDPFVCNSLVRMYLELGKIGFARCVFDKMPERDLISWNSMLVGFLRYGEVDLATELFREMPERDLVSCNILIDGYGKNGRCELAEEVFQMMDEKDVVSWTSMISAYAVNRYSSKALDLFREMLSAGVKPDIPAIVSVLAAIADLGLVEEGRWVHTYLSVNRISLSSGFIGSALIDMYSKCGYIEDALDVFKKVSPRRNIGDWNSMISGLAIHGLGQEALEVFHDMERMNIKPDGITFLGLLNAFSHGGLIDEGQFYFKIMEEKYNIAPQLQHYGCLVDLFARAGRLSDALVVINQILVEADDLAWKTVLSACVKLGDVAIGETAALRAIELNPEDSSSYVMLSNLYAKAERWDDVAKIRQIMKRRGVRKIPGCSSIVVDGKLHQFLVSKDMDSKYGSKIHSKIEELVCRLKLEGYEPDLSQVLVDVEHDGKTSLLNLHSEKMALAFGLLNTMEGTPIHIVKNLRICCDCHAFIKLVSSVYKRKIVVRDQNRFHHFENGSCSCRDYW